MAAKEAGPFRMILTLGVAGMMSGGLLVGVHLVTAPLIEDNATRAVTSAAAEVVAENEKGPKLTTKTLVIEGGKLVEFKGKGLPKGKDARFVFGRFDDKGKLVGYAIPAAGNGFQDVIKLVFGLDPYTRRVIGMRILESKETPGLGDKIYKDKIFVAQFDDLPLSPEDDDILVTKKGKTKPFEIDAISGATISTKAVAKIINIANDEWLSQLPEAAAPAGKEGQ